MKPAPTLTPNADALLVDLAAAPAGYLDIRDPSAPVRAAAKLLDRLGFARLSVLRSQVGDPLVLWATTSGRVRALTPTITIITTRRPPRRALASIRCRVCTAVPPDPCGPPCRFCDRGYALKVCGDHDPPQALPGCSCFSGDPLRGDYVVAPVPVLEAHFPTGTTLSAKGRRALADIVSDGYARAVGR